MATGKIACYRRWFEYEQDAHEKVFASLATVPEQRRQSSEYRKAASWMAHLVAARKLWLGRLGAGPGFAGEFFPENVDLRQVQADWQEVAAQWTAYLGSVDDDEVDRVFEYQSLEGDRFKNQVEDVLTQMFGHSWYHRGQIAQLVRTAGGVPAVTDFIFWTREPVPAKTA